MHGIVFVHNPPTEAVRHTFWVPTVGLTANAVPTIANTEMAVKANLNLFIAFGIKG
jgi:hypothetical protein